MIELLWRILPAAALLAAPATVSPSTAGEPTLEERLSGELGRVYASLLQKVGSPIKVGSREWDEALRASTRAVLAVKPVEGCTDEFYAEHICFLRPMIMSSTAMAPSLEEGDAVMMVPASLDRPLRRGDVVAFEPDLNIFRIVGLPGESIELKKGIVLVDGVPLPREPTAATIPSLFGDRLSVFHETTPEGGVYEIALDVEGSSLPSADNAGPFDVPAGHYFILGDNRHNAADSRHPDRIGGSNFVPAEAIIGRALIIYASRDISRIGQRLD